MKLDAEHFKEFTEVLQGAFPTKSKLAQMLKFGPDKHLESIVGEGGLQDIIFELIRVAEAQGWIIELIEGARKDNPGNTELEAFEKKIKQHYQNDPNVPKDDTKEKDIPIPPCPYKGLAAFKEKDKDDFFGRGKFVKDLVEYLHKNPLVALIGNSGSGKSSVVFAGLVPKLKEEGWLIASFRPQNDPFYEVAAALVDYVDPELTERLRLKEIKGYVEDFEKNALWIQEVTKNIIRRQERPLLLIADQFEETFTLNPDKNLQHNFLDHLVKLAQEEQKQFRFILTMRSDFVSHTLQHADFGGVLDKSTRMLTAMSREELKEAIEEPAKTHNVSLEAGLTDVILDDVLTDKDKGDVAGRLPLLEFALTELWQKQEKLILTYKAYEAIGKVEGALARHAEKIFEDYSPKEQKQLEYIFTQLVRPGEGTEDTRQICTKKQLGEKSWDLVARLANERLLITGTLDKEGKKEETAEVIHEALIRRWQKLRGWVDTNREFITWRNYLRHTIETWEKENKDGSMLLQGRRLEQAEEYLEKYKGQLEDAKEFIKASTTKQKEIEEKQKRRQRNLVFAISAIAAVFAILAGLAIWFGNDARLAQKETEVARLEEEKQHKQAEENAKDAEVARVEAEKQADISLARYLGFVARDADSKETTPDLRLLLAAEATEIYNGAESYRDTLVPVLQSINPNISAYRKDNEFVFSPDKKTMVSASFDGSLSFWDVAKGKVIKFTGKAHEGRVWGLEYLPETDVLVTSGEDGTVAFWQGKTGEIISEAKKVHEGKVDDFKYLLETDVLITIGEDDTVAFWQGKTGEVISEIQKVHEGRVDEFEYLPETDVLVTRGKDGIVAFWQGKTGKVISEAQKAHEGWVLYFKYLPEVDVLITSGHDDTVTFWQGKTGKVISEAQKAHEGGVRIFEYLPETDVLVTGDEDGTVAFWQGKTGKAIGETQKAHEGGVRRFEYLPETDVLATIGRDGTVAFWRATTGEVISEAQKAHEGGVRDFEYLPEADVLVTTAVDGKAFWQGTTGEIIRKIQKAHEGGVGSFEYLPEADVLVIIGEDGTVAFWDILTGNLLAKKIQPNYKEISTMKFIEEKQTLVFGGEDGTIVFWDVNRGPRAIWKKQACHKAGRNLTQKEWEKYMDGRPYEKTCPQYPLVYNTQ